jgi:hypothetical protein
LIYNYLENPAAMRIIWISQFQNQKHKFELEERNRKFWWKLGTPFKCSSQVLVIRVTKSS